MSQVNDDALPSPAPPALSLLPTSRATIYDVARRAGVSHMTVSRYLRNPVAIRPENRARVEQALHELEYRPNATARSLATSTSNRLGAITHEIDQFGPSKTLLGASRAAREAGFLLDVISFDVADSEDIRLAIETANAQDVAGIIAFGSTDSVIESFHEAGFYVPWIVAGEDDDRVGDHEATINGSGIDLLVEHLATLGHTRFLEIAGPNDWVSARNRSFAVDRALNTRGLELVGRQHGDWSPSSGYDALHRFPDMRGATAILAANDQMALGAMRALAERGVSIPDQMSVAGFDDIPEAAFMQPPLTTVGVDFELQGRQQIFRLLDLVESSSRHDASLRMAHLSIRQSTAAPRQPSAH